MLVPFYVVRTGQFSSVSLFGAGLLAVVLTGSVPVFWWGCAMFRTDKVPGPVNLWAILLIFLWLLALAGYAIEGLFNGFRGGQMAFAFLLGSGVGSLIMTGAVPMIWWVIMGCPIDKAAGPFSLWAVILAVCWLLALGSYLRAAGY